MTIITTTKVGIHQGDLEDQLGLFDFRMTRTKSALGNTKQYTFFDNSNQYLLMVSKSIMPVTTATDYNLIATVTSEDNLRNAQILAKLEPELKIQLKSAKRSLELHMNSLNSVFEIYRRVGWENVRELLAHDNP